jgi:hypothetical protein
MDRSPFRTLMTKNFPSAPPSLQLLEDLFILRCTLKSWSSTLRRLSSPRPLHPSRVQSRLPSGSFRKRYYRWRALILPAAKFERRTLLQRGWCLH